MWSTRENRKEGVWWFQKKEKVQSGRGLGKFHASARVVVIAGGRGEGKEDICGLPYHVPGGGEQ